MLAETPIRSFVDYVTLVYHEARNVRHLIRAGVLDDAPWKYLVSLPTNRNEAWEGLQVVRKQAYVAATSSDVEQVFRKRFRVSLQQLRDMYANPAWRGSGYGGNAWQGITALVIELSQADPSTAAALIERLAVARHNTGTVGGKLAQLDRALYDGRAPSQR